MPIVEGTCTCLICDKENGPYRKWLKFAILLILLNYCSDTLTIVDSRQVFFLYQCS